MIDLSDAELRAFEALAQSGEGQIVAGYLDRLEQHLSNELIDKSNPTPADISGAKQMRKLVKTLKERFQARATMSAEIPRVD